jgi:hypothetical protein
MVLGTETLVLSKGPLEVRIHTLSILILPEILRYFHINTINIMDYILVTQEKSALLYTRRSIPL